MHALLLLQEGLIAESGELSQIMMTQQELVLEGEASGRVACYTPSSPSPSPLSSGKSSGATQQENWSVLLNVLDFLCTMTEHMKVLASTAKASAD